MLKKGANRCSPVFCSLMISKQFCELSRRRTGTNNRLAVFWLFVMFAESQIEASERDPEYGKHGCETLFFGEPVIQPADLEKDCNSFMFVLGVGGITLPSFLSGTGLLSISVDRIGLVARTTCRRKPFCWCCCDFMLSRISNPPSTSNS